MRHTTFPFIGSPVDSSIIFRKVVEQYSILRRYDINNKYRMSDKKNGNTEEEYKSRKHYLNVQDPIAAHRIDLCRRVVRKEQLVS